MTANPNRQLTAAVARAFGPVLDQVVFVGGCATGLLISDPAAPAVRATDDVDVVASVASYFHDYPKLSEKLRILGFQEDIREGAPLCRWIVNGMVVDVMPLDAEVLGFSNRWYPEAFATAQEFELEPNLSIRLTTAPCFLATKLEAFAGRGKRDYLGSTDIDDIIALLDGRAELIDEVQTASVKVRTFLAAEAQRLCEDAAFLQSIAGHLQPDEASQSRARIIMNRLNAIAELTANRTASS